MLSLGEINIGSTLGKYTLETEIGRGGMGIVYLALDTALGRKVALKVLHPIHGADKGFIERFRAEARVIAALAHPNIVHINNLETFDNRFLIDMEYVSNGSLHDALYGRVNTLTSLAGLAHQILQALEACHSKGIVHRDLKPSNVLIDKNRQVKLCDFGIATAYADNYERTAGNPPTTGFYLGTPRYAPPELWDGAHPTCSWDLYSLGVMLYEGLTGAPPYDGDSPLAILKARIQNGIPPVSERAPKVSPQLGSLIDAMLAEKPKDRPKSTAEALNLLESTPEFDASQELAKVVTVAMPAPKHVKLAARRKADIARFRSILAFGAAVAFGSVLVISAIWYIATKRVEQIQVADSPRPMSVESASENRILDVSEMLSLPRTESESDWKVLDIDVINNRLDNEMDGLLVSAASGNQHTMYAFSPKAIWKLNLSSISDRDFNIQGEFARYVDEGATIFRQGTIEGSGIWQSPETLLASLTLIDGGENSEIAATMSTTLADDVTTSTGFLVQLEDAALIQRLLYDELTWRNASLAVDYYQILPSLPVSRIQPRFVQFLRNEVVVDGKFEPVWQTLAEDTAPYEWKLPGVPYAAKSTMIALHSGEDLGVAINLSHRIKPDWKVVLSILPVFDVPASESPVYLVSLDSRGERETVCMVGTRKIDWPNTAELQAVNTDTGWSAECLLPMAELTLDTLDRTTTYVRVNCQVIEVTADGTTNCLARWGWPDVSTATHGVLVKIKPSRDL